MTLQQTGAPTAKVYASRHSSAATTYDNHDVATSGRTDGKSLRVETFNKK